MRMLTAGVHVLVTVMAMSPAPAHADAPLHDAQFVLHETQFAPLHDGQLGGQLAGQIASTYDEAACDPSDSGECAPPQDPLSLFDFEPAPAVLDCNDARASVILADMIGTCDMPKHSGLQLAPPTVRTGSSGPQLRIADGTRCKDRCPLRPPRANDAPLLLSARVPLVPALDEAPLDVHEQPLQMRAEDLRLDRPPRA